MIMEFVPGDWLLGVWYTENPHFNYMIILKRDDEENHWVGYARTRVTNDDKIFNSTDDRKFSDLNIKNCTADEAIIEIEKLTKAICDEFGGMKDSIIVKGDTKKLVELSKSKLWFHLSTTQNVSEELQ